MSNVSLEVVNQIKQLKQYANELRGSYQRWRERIEDSSCDKHEFSFVKQDTRFHSFNVNISLTTLTGYYGNSSCSTFISVPNKVAEEALRWYLEQNKDIVLDEMARYLDKKSASMLEAARSEVSEISRMLDNVEGDAKDIEDTNHEENTR